MLKQDYSKFQEAVDSYLTLTQALTQVYFSMVNKITCRLHLRYLYFVQYHEKVKRICDFTDTKCMITIGIYSYNGSFQSASEDSLICSRKYY